MEIDTVALEAMEVRLARIENGYERVHGRLGALEQRLGGLESRLTSGMASLRYEMLEAVETLRTDVRRGEEERRGQTTARFSWLLFLMLGSILVPILRELAR